MNERIRKLAEQCYEKWGLLPIYVFNIGKFADLVTAAEREECARVCEDGVITHKGQRILHGVDCAKLIRARGEECQERLKKH